MAETREREDLRSMIEHMESVEAAGGARIDPGEAKAMADVFRARLATLSTPREPLSLPGHDCERIADLTPRMTGPDREMWVGRLLEPIEGYPEEEWCLHIRTPEKPEIVFGHNEADWEFMAVLSLAALGRHINPRWLERMAESAHRAAGQEPPEFQNPATPREPEVVAWLIERDAKMDGTWRIEGATTVRPGSATWGNGQMRFTPLYAGSPPTDEDGREGDGDE